MDQGHLGTVKFGGLLTILIKGGREGWLRGKIVKPHWNLSLQTPLEEIPPPPELIIFVTVFSEQVYSTEIFC